ncbi:GNAT family N-acetyltransferase [Sphingobium sp. YR768]|uniref:GNAT family N-acetyltransferase n=1 Tax=Sphingobium sp. YR768 TaxID=1884365 RepID=UPI00210A03B0|nr:GNAT family N-acetyltransferase [Sphingobium sp. YR768]
MRTLSFCCGVAEIDKWFRSKSLKDHDRRKHIVTCAHDAGADTQPIGFYALSTVIEEARLLAGAPYIPFFGNPRYFPCLSMVYLAVAQDRQRQGVGSTMMVKVILDFADYGEQIGLPLLILTPLNRAVADFYEGLGFERYRSGAGMFLPLQTAIDMRDQLRAAE